MKNFLLTLTLGFSSFLLGASKEEILKKGEALYNGAGSCVACHMKDGKGQKGSVPALAQSDWLKNGTDRSIAIALRGLAGPVKVNGKNFYSAMPPQLLFDDEKLAHILSYVNQAWGNKERFVKEEEVAKARKSLPVSVYTPQTLLKQFPFDKNLRRKNGTFTPTYDDMITTIIKPIVYRTFMPGASPAAFAIALPGDHYFCWDAGECRLRYVWTKGGFIRSNQSHWSSNGKPVAQFNGTPYYRARTSLLQDESFDDLSRTNLNKPIYDTSEAKDFPILIEGIDRDPVFLGYRLIDQYPQFRYSLGKHIITELIRVNKESTGVERTFTISPPAKTSFRLTPSEESSISCSRGTLNQHGTLHLNQEESVRFSIIISPMEGSK
jgi:mono/diheme cytochrome c family protein